MCVKAKGFPGRKRDRHSLDPLLLSKLPRPHRAQLCGCGPAGCGEVWLPVVLEQGDLLLEHRKMALASEMATPEEGVVTRAVGSAIPYDWSVLKYLMCTPSLLII